MRTALYFPHTEVRSESLVRNALLTWDRLEYIVPSLKYQPHYTNAGMAEAIKLIGEARTVTNEEREFVHELIDDLLQEGIPEIFKYSPRDGRPYEIYPQKFSRSTFALLQHRGLTDGRLSNNDYPVSEATGLSLMAILADVLAGKSKARVTDRSEAYATIANAPVMSPKSANAVRAPINGEHDRIISLTLKTIALDQVPLERLIEFRKQEARAGGHHLTSLRHNYLDAVAKQVKLLSEADYTLADREQLNREFAVDMDKNLRELKERLGFARDEAWLSQGVIALAIAGAGFLASAASGGIALPAVIAATGGPVLLGGLLNTGIKLAKARREIMLNHPMAYLFEFQSPDIIGRMVTKPL